jgi:hypothetical protein
MTNRFKYSRNVASQLTLLVFVPWVWWNWAVFKITPASVILGAVVGFILSFLILYYWPLGPVVRKTRPALTEEEMEAVNTRNRLEVAKAAFISGGMAIGNVDEEGNLTIQVHKLPGTKSGNPELLS